MRLVHVLALRNLAGGTDFRPVVHCHQVRLATAECRCGAAVRGDSCEPLAQAHRQLADFRLPKGNVASGQKSVLPGNRHSRAGGNLEMRRLDSRLRGNDKLIALPVPSVSPWLIFPIHLFVAPRGGHFSRLHLPFKSAYGLVS